MIKRRPYDSRITVMNDACNKLTDTYLEEWGLSMGLKAVYGTGYKDVIQCNRDYVKVLKEIQKLKEEISINVASLKEIPLGDHYVDLRNWNNDRK